MSGSASFQSVRKSLCGERPDAGGIGIRSLRGSRLQRISPSHSQMSECPRPAVSDDAAVIKNLLELGSGSVALSSRQICLSS